MSTSPSSGSERTVAVARLERDPTKPPRDVRAKAGARVGRRVRLRVPRDDAPAATLLDATGFPPDPPDAAAPPPPPPTRARVRAGDLVLAGPITPPLPPPARLDDPPLERQIGTLRADGVAVQLRFAPTRASAAAAAAGEKNPGGGEASGAAPGPLAYRLLDAALTADDRSPDGRAALAAINRAIRLEGPAEAAGSPARIGRSKDLWEPQPYAPEDDGYDASDPGKLKYDSRGKELHERRMREDVERENQAWARSRETRDPLLDRLETAQNEAARCAAERDAATVAARRLDKDARDRLERTQNKGLPGEEPGASSSEGVFLTAELLSEARDVVRRGGISYGSMCPGGDAHVFDPRFFLADVAVDAETGGGVTASRLREVAAERDRLLARAVEAMKGLELEIRDRRTWDHFESGVETRDVLENGVRRVDMERMLGRPATKADVEASMAIPAEERLRIVGGVDVDRAKITGRDEYVARLPMR